MYVGAPMLGTRVGILTITDPQRGLWRLAECLLWALEDEPVRRGGQIPAKVSIFPIPNYKVVENNPDQAKADSSRSPCSAAVAAGTRLQDWLRNLDVMIVSEKVMPKTFSLARRLQVRVIFIPMVDWASHHGGINGWARCVRNTGCEVWGITQKVTSTLKAVGLDAKLVLWSIPDSIARAPNVRENDEVTFLINAGMGGWQNRRGVDIALKAFKIAQRKTSNIRIIVKSVKALNRYVPDDLLDTDGIEIIEGLIDRDELAALHTQVDAVLYPSRWEGFGLSLLEALHVGVPVIATDGWPMNETIIHGHNGLLVKAQHVGEVRLAQHWECDPKALAEQMVTFAINPKLRRRLTCPDPSELTSRQHRFVMRVRELVLNETQPRVMIFRQKSDPGWRRSEEYWADALRAHGYIVDIGYLDSPKERICKQLNKPHDFVMVSKASSKFISTLGGLTDKPIILWHHDLCAPRSAWLHSVADHVDLMCVPETGLSARIPKMTAPLLTLLPGAKVDGDRGPGKRPTQPTQLDIGPDVVFLGNGRANGTRQSVLEKLSKYYDVHAYGVGWEGEKFQTHPARWSTKAAQTNQEALVTLSISASANTPHYTSNRLFNSCGAGACVAVEVYPGLNEYYPLDCVAKFHSPDESVRVVGQLLKNKTRRMEMRIRAEEHTWRNHTWEDRISCLLSAVRDVVIVRRNRGHHAVVKYWDDRATQMGSRAVGYYGWGKQKFREETKEWWKRMSTYLNTIPNMKECAVLDFGSGASRFSVQLAQKGFHVTGVEISEALLRLGAKNKRKNVDLVQITPEQTLPFPDNSFDVLWICLVLQHISDLSFAMVVSDLQRVLRRNGMILICENTEQSKGRISSSGHMVFRSIEEYTKSFPGIKRVDEFQVAGETHTIFAGQSHG